MIQARESKQRVKVMKKFVLLSLVSALFANAAIADIYQESVNNCDEHEMRAALDRAAAEKRAVITIVECDNGIVRTIEKPMVSVAPVQVAPVAKPCPSCGCGCADREEVVKREYFVRETVQQYRPVVQYVPSGTYTRVKPACGNGCNNY